MKNSVAIWADPPPPETSDLHINYWIIKRRRRNHFIDFGLKLINWDGGKVRIHIPIKNLSNNNILEIGNELKERELANALFNENCTINLGQNKRFVISLPAEELTVFEFDVENDIYSKQLYNGTLFTINIPNEKNTWYIRFRIKISFTNALSNFFRHMSWNTIRSVFSQKHTPGGSFYQSVRSSVEAVDFRINDKRSLNLSLLDENQNKLITPEKLHFFLIHEHDEDFIFSTTRAKGVRLLEDEIWHKYLRDISKRKKKYCANHWTCTPAPNEGWEIFLKIRYESANTLTIIIYLAIVSAIAFSINIGSSFFYDYCKDKKISSYFNKVTTGETEKQ